MVGQEALHPRLLLGRHTEELHPLDADQWSLAVYVHCATLLRLLPEQINRDNVDGIQTVVEFDLLRKGETRLGEFDEQRLPINGDARDVGIVLDMTRHLDREAVGQQAIWGT